MGKREAWADAQLDALARRCPEALTLARLLAPAVTADAALIRSMRLALLPGSGAWIEAELWHSPLVKARSASGLRFEPAVSERLRGQLAAAWQQDGAGERERILEARGVMASAHAGLSPALALEERVAWAAVMGELDEIEAALASAVKGVLDASRPGLAAWAGRETGTQPEAASPAQILSDLPPARLGIARRGPVLILGAAEWRAGFALPVPDSEPRLVEVLLQDDDGALQRMPHAIGAWATQEIEVGRARVQLVNALGETFEVPGFERWAGGGAAYCRLNLQHGQREGMGEGYMLTLKRSDVDGHGTEFDFIGGSIDELGPRRGPSLAQLTNEADLAYWISRVFEKGHESPLLSSRVLTALRPDDDIELRLEDEAARLPWEYMLGELGVNGRVVRGGSDGVGQRGRAPEGHAVLLAAVGDPGRPSPANLEGIFRAARFDVEALPGASAEALLAYLHRHPWRVLHLESELDPARNPDFRDGAPALPIGDGTALTPGDLEQLLVMPELVVIRGRSRIGGGFGGSWGKSLCKGLVSAVLVNDWEVTDSIASAFFDSFYEALTAGSTAAEAALIARLETRRRYPDSLSWAAFQLHGDGEYRLPQVSRRKKAATKATKARPTEPYELRAIRALEQRSVPQPGLYALDTSPVPPQLHGMDGSAPVHGRALLFIHGMGSSMLGSFAGMWSPDNLAAWRELASAYSGRMLCFEHWGLSRSPLENALELVRALPFGIELTLLSVSDGGLIGELLCRAGRVADMTEWEDDDFWDGSGRGNERVAPFDEADFGLFDGAARETLERLSKEMMARSLRVADFVRIACPVRGTTYPVRAKQVFGGIARLMSRVGSVAGGLPLQLLDAIVDPSRVPGLRAMDPSSPLIRMLNRPGVRVDSALAVVAGTFRADSLTGRLKAGVLGLLVDDDNDLLVPTASMFGGAARTRPARFVRFEGGDINHFSYLEQGEVVRTVVDRLIHDSPGSAWQIVQDQRSPAPRVLVVHDASQPADALEQCAAALAPLENEGRIRLAVTPDDGPMLRNDGMRGPLTEALARTRVLVLLLTPGLLRSAGLQYSLRTLQRRLDDGGCSLLPVWMVPDLFEAMDPSTGTPLPDWLLARLRDVQGLRPEPLEDPATWHEVRDVVLRLLDAGGGRQAR